MKTLFIINNYYKSYTIIYKFLGKQTMFLLLCYMSEIFLKLVANST